MTTAWPCWPSSTRGAPTASLYVPATATGRAKRNPRLIARAVVQCRARQIDENVVVHRRFVKMGRVTVSLRKCHTNLLISHAPPKQVR